MRKYQFIIISTLLFSSCIVATLNPIVIKGQKFFDSVTKEQFFIKGVAYQPREDDVSTNTTTSDPLANPEGCKRDAPLIKDLGANAIRVYQVDHTKNHDACMKTMAENGIYVILGISTPHYSIDRDHPTYDVSMYKAYRATVTSFATYPHLLAFIAGNEVTNGTTNTRAASYAKAVLRDIKSLLRQSDLRVVPVGYASNDDVYIRDSVKDFFVCDGDDQNSHADFLGLNLYEWCGGATFESSGYAARTKELESYGRPVFLSEYGCNVVEPRTFSEVEAIFGSQMTSVWSGGVVYEWSQENAYGLVKIASSHASNVEPLIDYHNLYNVLRNVDPKGVKMDDYQVPAAPPVPPCPAMSSYWDAATVLPPTPSEGACQCMKDNLSCVLSDSVNKHTHNESIIGAQLDIMCGLVSCKEISESEKGIYGAFSFCNADFKLSWLYNLYTAQTKHSTSPVQCDFNGYAQPIVPRRNDIDTCASIKPDTYFSSDTINARVSINLPLLIALYLSLLVFHIGV